MRTRIAPTPSGYLHVGNAVNFATIDRFAQQHGIELVLRIDDFDAVRTRQAYLDDIEHVLEWLEIIPKERSSNSTDHTTYRAALAQLPVYNCRCSRTSKWCDCAALAYPLVPHESAAKLAGTDIVLWRRDDVPAYHLVNVVDDHRMGISHVIRGEDLRESSAIHAELARRLGIAPPVYLHHPLVTDASGAKLSKSTLRSGEPMTRDAETREWVREHARLMSLT